MKKLFYLGVLGFIIFLLVVKVDYNNSPTVSSGSLQNISSQSISGDQEKVEKVSLLEKLSTIKEIFFTENENSDETFISEVLGKFKKITNIFAKEKVKVLPEMKEGDNPTKISTISNTITSGNGLSKILKSVEVSNDEAREKEDGLEYPSVENFFQDTKKRGESIVLEEDFVKSDENVKVIITKYFDKETESDIFKLYILKIRENKVVVFFNSNI
jgi:hypothetical protein